MHIEYNDAQSTLLQRLHKREIFHEIIWYNIARNKNTVCPKCSHILHSSKSVPIFENLVKS